MPSKTSETSNTRKRLTRVSLVLLVIALVASLGWNVWQHRVNRDYFGETRSLIELFHSGDIKSRNRIALLCLSGTVSPPFTGRLIAQIKRARRDENVKGAVLVVDSPGGFVADSHQIFHELKKLSSKKPVFVSMKRIAASGGYYVAMGAGPDSVIFAEPTTWTGSIGVIIPRYNAAELIKRVGVAAEPLTTGPYKDTMSPFRDLTEDEKELWAKIMDDSFGRFVRVIHENRANLSQEQVETIATGQVYTATQAHKNGLVDRIGFLEDAVAALQERLQLSSVRVVSYRRPPTWLETVTGISITTESIDPLATLMEASVPRAMYLCSWNPIVPVLRRDADLLR